MSVIDKMEQNNFMKLVWVIAFVAFAAVSCWATAESLHLLLSSWPLAMCWVVAVGFFLIASLGSKMIVDSLNQNIYMEKRGVKLAFGTVLLLVFWLACSLPTNTHTFFYRSLISEKVNSDIAVTSGYLLQVKNNSKNGKATETKINDLRNKVEVLFGELEAEIKNDAKPGFGPKAEAILRKFANILDVAKIEPLSYSSTTEAARKKLCDAYRSKILLLRNSREAGLRASTEKPNPENMKEVERDIKNLALMKDYVANKTIDLNNAEDVEGVCDKLNTAYNTVKRNKDFVNFSPESDEELYTAENPVTKVRRMISVYDVWSDFLKGDYAGHGFGFWIIISALVDIAGFIFFDLAFRTHDI